MKKILFLLLCSVVMYGQVPADATPLENVQITNNVISTTAPFVNVQSSTGVVNKINKTDLVDAIIVNTTSELTSAIGNVNKLYATRDNTLIYRYNGSIYVPIGGGDVSGKEDIANKSSSFTASSTVTYANTKALVDGLATKATGTGTANGINTGDNATNTQYSGLVTNSTHSGDATGATVLTLATVNANVGSFGSASIVPQYTVNAKGLTTASANVPIQIAQSQVTSLSADLGLKEDIANKQNSLATDGTNTKYPTVTAVNAGIAAVDMGNMKLTGDQSVTGQKTFNSLLGKSSIVIVNAFANSLGLQVDNSNTSSGIKSNNSSTGSGIVSNQTSTGTGFNYVGQSNGVNTFTVNKTGDIIGNTYTGGATLTGAPTAPTPTTTTGIANKSYVDSAIATADANYMKLTTNQSFTGVKSGNSGTGRQVEFLGTTGAINASSFSPSTAPAFYGLAGGANTVFFAIKTVGDTGSAFQLKGSDSQIKFNVDHLGATTATSFINSTAPAANVLLAGGGTLANPITGTGTTNFLPKFTGAGTVGNSIVSDGGSFIGINAKLNIGSDLNETFFQSTEAKRISFYTFNSPQALSILNNGNTLIGTVADNGSKLQVAGAATFSSSVTASLLKPTVYTVATLPTPPSTGTGSYATVSDAVAPAYLTPVMGGGTVVTPVFYNGSNWICH